MGVIEYPREHRATRLGRHAGYRASWPVQQRLASQPHVKPGSRSLFVSLFHMAASQQPAHCCMVQAPLAGAKAIQRGLCDSEG
jgi:hypothetical protein